MGDFDSPEPHQIEQVLSASLARDFHHPGPWRVNGPDERRLKCTANDCRLEIVLGCFPDKGWSVLRGPGVGFLCPWNPELRSVRKPYDGVI
jgi:hypothetical protein